MLVAGYIVLCTMKTMSIDSSYTFNDAAKGARDTRELYRLLERRVASREWDLRDLYVGMIGDVGDLAQLIGSFEGVRPGPDDILDAISHELADVLWSLFCIADSLNISLEDAFKQLVTDLEIRISEKLEK